MWGTLAVVLHDRVQPARDDRVPDLQGPGRSRPQYPLVSKEGPKKDKEEIKVALFVSQGTGQSFEFAGAENTIASEMARKHSRTRQGKQAEGTVVIRTAEGEPVQVQESDVEGHARQRLGQGPRRRLRPRNPPRQDAPLSAGQPEPALRGSRRSVGVHVRRGGRRRRTAVPMCTITPTRRRGFRDATAIPLGHSARSSWNGSRSNWRSSTSTTSTSSGIAEGR